MRELFEGREVNRGELNTYQLREDHWVLADLAGKGSCSNCAGTEMAQAAIDIWIASRNLESRVCSAP